MISVGSRFAASNPFICFKLQIMDVANEVIEVISLFLNHDDGGPLLITDESIIVPKCFIQPRVLICNLLRVWESGFLHLD